MDSSSLLSGKSDAMPSSSTKITEKKEEGKVRLAVVAGLFATTGSLLGKLAGCVEATSVVSNATFIIQFSFGEEK